MADAVVLNQSITLLEFTSQIIDLFTRKDPITTTHDARLLAANEFLQFLTDWKSQATSPKHFLSDKLWFDLKSMIVGFQEVVRIKTSQFPGAQIKPVIVNQDILENIFCQIRGSHGQNDHPKYHMYGAALTSVNVGQSVISKKGNTRGNSSSLPSAGLPNEHPFKKRENNYTSIIKALVNFIGMLDLQTKVEWMITLLKYQS